MSLDDYSKAYKLGKKEYQYRMMHGMNPMLEVLDDILPTRGSFSEIPLGLVQIPIDQIVGTKTEGRSNAFAANFMPILRETTEFARKWAQLSTSHLNEGIREPVKAYEYMNKFYILEGNKRVSVMKYFDAVSIPGTVIRIIPKRTEEKENKIYFEFLDFYECSKVNYIWFSEVGNFPKLQKAVGKKPDEMWSEDDRLLFSSTYTRFSIEFKQQGGEEIKITPGDAFLAFIMLYGYDSVCEMTTRELKNLITKNREDFKLLEQEESIDLKLNPNQEKASFLKLILPSSMTELKIAFVYEKTAGISAWTYSHELGRLHLEQVFKGQVQTIYYDNVTNETIDEVLQDAIEKQCNMIITTTPAFVQASVKAAIAYPQIRILNCSLNTSHRYIRTYYARMYEAKFVMGAVAGAMTENDKISYLADIPLYGTIADINAFARGVSLVNPRAKIYLDWTSKKDQDVYENIRKIGAGCISGKDMVIPEEASRAFGLYSMNGEETRNLAMPLWHWGRFYERLIRTIMNGTWKYDDDSIEKKAINYWWGMSAGVVDVVCSKSLPEGTKQLIRMLKKSVSREEIHPFSGVLYSQTDVVQSDPDRTLSPEEIATMDWLGDNVIGEIPASDELLEAVRPTVLQQGIENKKG